MQKIGRKIVSGLSVAVSTAFACVPAYAASIGIDVGSRPSLNDPVTVAAFADTLKNFKALGTAFAGICTIIALVMLVISITKLSASADNDAMRRKALIGILFSGISLALFGGATVIFGVFWNFIS